MLCSSEIKKLHYHRVGQQFFNVPCKEGDIFFVEKKTPLLFTRIFKLLRSYCTNVYCIFHEANNNSNMYHTFLKFLKPSKPNNKPGFDILILLNWQNINHPSNNLAFNKILLLMEVVKPVDFYRDPASKEKAWRTSVYTRYLRAKSLTKI